MARKRRRLLASHIVADPEICHGKPTFVGTRIMVAQVLKQVAKGMTWNEISAEWRGDVTNDAIAEAIELVERRRVADDEEVDVVSSGAFGHPLAEFAGMLKGDSLAEPWKRA